LYSLNMEKSITELAREVEGRARGMYENMLKVDRVSYLFELGKLSQAVDELNTRLNILKSGADAGVKVVSEFEARQIQNGI
jgi:hypothetical protein